MRIYAQALCLVLVIMTGSGSASAVDREAVLKKAGVKDAAETNYEQRMLASRAERIEEAQKNYEQRLSGPKIAKDVTVLISLAGRVGWDEISKMLKRCGCTLQQIHRSVGETQMAHIVSPAQIDDAKFRASMDRGFITQLESTIQAIEQDRKTPVPGIDADRWALQKLAAFSDALVDARSKGFTANGIVVTGTIHQIEELRIADPAKVLAIEFLEGSQRRFVIPLETYK